MTSADPDVGAGLALLVPLQAAVGGEGELAESAAAMPIRDATPRVSPPLPKNATRY
jgi:hypothetical protein